MDTPTHRDPIKKRVLFRAPPKTSAAARYFLFRASLTEHPSFTERGRERPEAQPIRDAETRCGGVRGGRRARARRGHPGVGRGAFQEQGFREGRQVPVRVPAHAGAGLRHPRRGALAGRGDTRHRGQRLLRLLRRHRAPGRQAPRKDVLRHIRLGAGGGGGGVVPVRRGAERGRDGGFHHDQAARRWHHGHRLRRAQGLGLRVGVRRGRHRHRLRDHGLRRRPPAEERGAGGNAGRRHGAAKQPDSRGLPRSTGVRWPRRQAAWRDHSLRLMARVSVFCFSAW